MNTVGFVDTTLRDLTTYPWGSGIAADDVALATASLARTGARALEVVDPRVARAVLELRTESPWDRVRAVVRNAGATPVGVVVHGRLLWSDRPVTDEVATRFVMCAAENGVRRVRSLDPLNNAGHMQALAAACQGAGIEFVPTLVAGPAPGPGDRRWADEAAALAALPGASAVCISDGGGHLSPTNLVALVQAVVAAASLPVEMLIQAPGGLAPLLGASAISAGASVVHTAVGSAALVGARPSVETVRAALLGTGRELECDPGAIADAARIVAGMLTADRLSQGSAAVFGSAVSIPPDLEVGLMSRLSRVGMSPLLSDVADEAARVAAELGNVTFAFPLGDALVAQASEHVINGERWTHVQPALAAAAAGVYGPTRGDVSEEVARAAAGVDYADTIPSEVAGLGDAAEMADEDRVLMAQFPEATERLRARRLSLRAEVDDSEGATIDRALLETLIQAVEGSDEAEVSVEVGGARVTVRRAAPSAAPVPGAPGASSAAGAADGMTRVESIMVGTFYRASSPDAEPFTDVGRKVAKGQVLCLIEAMKLFNEITSPCDGVVREIAVQNSEGVEFGQLLFLIEPS
ncbi:MAG: hypothetical protein KDC33_10415 [Thermoleophilia bacterium]|nr:hypothetical protein [Thermoleophilia bacterium]